MIDKTLTDCILVTKMFQMILNKLHFDPPEKAIIAMYLEEAAKAECQEIEQLERMIHSE